MSRYWLCTVKMENWPVVRTERLWGVSIKFRRKIELMNIEDKIIFYVTPATIGGLFEVTSKMFEDATPIFPGGIYPLRVKVRPILVLNPPIDFKPLIPSLNFIKDKKRWSAYIRLPIREISYDDYNRIVNYIEENISLRRRYST